MAYKVITAVTSEPVSLVEARLQCKLTADDTTDYDALLTALCTAAREFAEHRTGRALALQTLELVLDDFPADDGAIELPAPPALSVTSVKYYDTDDTEQTLSSGAYELLTDGDVHKIALTPDNTWPTVSSEKASPVRVRFVTGYGAGHPTGSPYLSVPKAAKAAMLLHIEIESPLNAHTPAEREAKEKARDSLLDTVRIYG
jgi:uncharacterized phiE125 gp8 family phage protein